MKLIHISLYSIIILVFTLLVACSDSLQANSKESSSPQSLPNSTKKLSLKTKPSTITPIMKTDKEWKQQLSAKAYNILRQNGTERPFGPDYKSFKEISDGSFHCAGCDLLLFDADTSFDSRSGWPSFWKPAQDQNVTLIEDTSLGMKRVEVRCARCDGHLGHIFEGEDFGNPEDVRYCINAAALKHKPEEANTQEQGKE